MMDGYLSSLSDPRDFPFRFGFARDVDRELRCAICAEFLESAVALPCCGVAFCSLCLRTALAAGEPKCPNHLCCKPSSEASIRPLASLNRLVASWKDGREELLRILRAAEETRAMKPAISCATAKTTEYSKDKENFETTTIRSGDSGIATSTIKNDLKPPLMSTTERLSEIGNIVTTAPTLPSLPLPLFASSSSSSSQLSAANSIVSSSSAQSASSSTACASSSSRATSADDALLVKDIFDDASKGDTRESDRCIVCNAKISPSRMARHVEMHFVVEDREIRSREKRKSTITAQLGVEAKSEKTERKPLPKLNYHIMQMKDIKSRCESLKLSTVGKKEKLIHRHRTYTLLYNANLDSVNPKTEAQLRAELTRRENGGGGGGGGLNNDKGDSSQAASFFTQRETVKEDSDSVGQKINKKSKPEVIEKVMKDYEASHRSQFSDLIAKAKLSREGKKEENVAGKAGEEGNVRRDDSSKTQIKNLKEEVLEELGDSEPSSTDRDALGNSSTSRPEEGSRTPQKTQDDSCNEVFELRRGGILFHPPSRRSSSSSPFPAEQTSLRPGSACVESQAEDDDDDEARFSLLSQLGGALVSPGDEGRFFGDGGGVEDVDSRDARTPLENERDNYEEEEDDDDVDVSPNKNSGDRPIKNETTPSVQNMRDESVGGKRPLPSSELSPYFAPSPSKRPRTLGTETVSSAAIGGTKPDSSPDIGSQTSCSAAKDGFGGGDNEGSPILFPSNENSLEGAECEPNDASDRQARGAAFVSTQPLSEMDRRERGRLDDGEPDVNGNARASVGNFGRFICSYEEDDDSEDCGEDEMSACKTVLKLSRDSFFFHRPRDENSRLGTSVSRDDVSRSSSSSTSSALDSAAHPLPVSAPELSPPTSTVKSKPRSRKKVVPYAP